VARQRIREDPATRAAPAGDRALNARIADRLREMAELLQQQDGNPFHVGAYRRAADTVSGLDRGLDELVRTRGLDGLVSLPGIGRGIGAAILEMVPTGRWVQLERLRGGLEPERLFRVVPGIGPQLAARIHEALDVDTLEGLEQAAHDGRLEAVPGVGARRAAAVRAALQAMLGRTGPWPRRADGGEPAVALLLEIDREYRDKAAAGRLPRIAPRRFNPEGDAWLPVLHAERDGWHFTALFSNTARAHQLGRTGDWVVIYFYDRDHQEGQRTVVTEMRGPRAGRQGRGRGASMSTIAWIVTGGLLMSAIAMTGGLTTVLSPRALERILLPLVSLAAGTLLGGAFFHLIPEGTAVLGPLQAGIWVLAGFMAFLALEQLLHWHHCHRADAECRKPMTYLILLGDGLHNFLGGLAIASAFLVDPRVGITSWIAAAAHEVPQELGDFGVLLHGGWSRGRALAWNLASGLTFLLGALLAYAASFEYDVTPLVLFGAGNIIYIGASDLIPEIKAHASLAHSLLHFGFVLVGLLALLWIALRAGPG